MFSFMVALLHHIAAAGCEKRQKWYMFKSGDADALSKAILALCHDLDLRKNILCRFANSYKI